MDDQRPRFIYHPAPGPRPNGEFETPPPIELGRDARFALRWIRRRLGVVTPSSATVASPLFSSEVIDVEAAIAAIPQAPPEKPGIFSRILGNK